ncbi:MAG: uL15m family ribosomal protein [Methanothrix sp.]|uniref:Large ribosomal subunit protein uL15 n=1 Tax=Methanothrix harundinacea TaxID=301375 RepID=A0A101IH32_9EURY|nr:MAG: 50S ribosomal protein L15P [Methanothrix harundinacea]MDD2637804.1 uL15 family ribosomal protein [Methanothrix sp.]MDI9399962.1 uL15m family ribosomal protein [Euryarchaeota archaeon]KUK95144.1 MAG: 50S ribosomal protein L15P [Methanothrix harundinacea]MCP1391338.1 50S ribosomal protein L15 [Methanothrix harundinacea]
MPKSNLKKFRGSRTHGGGTHKNRRGGGSRGGRGNAGGCKHHFQREMMRGRAMGKHGFYKHNAKEVDVVNVGELDSMVDEDGRIDLGKVKVLGKGNISRPVAVSAKTFSAAAREKIEEAGGEVVVS